MGRKATPITIRGVEYPSIPLAAKAIGIHKMTIYQAQNRGTLDNVGLGLTGNKGHTAKPITIKGTYYPSNKAAAALGLTETHISNWRKVEKESTK